MTGVLASFRERGFGQDLDACCGQFFLCDSQGTGPQGWVLEGPTVEVNAEVFAPDAKPLLALQEIRTSVLASPALCLSEGADDVAENFLLRAADLDFPAAAKGPIRSLHLPDAGEQDALVAGALAARFIIS